MSPVQETIAAVATPSGRGGIGVIRVSGPAVESIAQRILGDLPSPRYATFVSFQDKDGEVLDSGIALYFPAPRSYTGEDVLELQGHGGMVVMSLLLDRCLECGARRARPGEFTERAFLNGKLDLAQAEAVADLIDSSTEQAARSAQRSLQGAFSSAVHELVERLIALRCHVEAAIDFPEEEEDYLADRLIVDKLEGIIADVDLLASNARQGCLLREGLRVVLAGAPNAGKSSLLNALAQQDRAIVSDTPGTTRDTIEIQIQIDGMPVYLVDTAGLRAAGNKVESEGIRRSYAALANADHALILVDDSDSTGNPDIPNAPVDVPQTLVFNKVDLTHRDSGGFQYEGQNAVAISAKRGNGLTELRQRLSRVAGLQQVESSTFIARRRHMEAIQRARENLLAGRQHLITAQAGELLAEELRLAQHALAEITGDFTSDQLLGRIFSSFCIGK